MGIRTDLALEAHEISKREAKKEGEIDGVIADIEEKDGITLTKIEITNENGEKALGKPIGKYITIDAPDIKYNTETYERVCKLMAEKLIELMGNVKDKTILVVGLGNGRITPDALGPEAVSKLIVTRHMKNTLGDSFASLSAISPGVLGTTGIEILSVVKGIVEEINPEVVIVIDALCAKSIKRISTTIQLSDTGIAPGAGVGNRRESLSEETLGKKVISVGVPTVVDAMTIVLESLDENQNNIKEEDREIIIRGVLENEEKRLIVTPSDIDLVIEKAAKTVANGINMAVHKNLTIEEIESFAE